jgi:Mrp family chromosome partitioning ATPase
MKSKNWTTLGVTSPGPEEGKSVTALNLALSLARDKNRNIFLLDLDLRSPRICSYLGIRPKTEIWTYFAGSSSADQLLFSIGVDNLALAGGVFSTSASSELLGTGRLEELIAYIRTIDPNGLILFDLPPVLNTADVLVVAPSIDAVLIVASVGKTRRDSLASAVDVLSPFEVAGLVLNRSQETVGDYYGS